MSSWSRTLVGSAGVLVLASAAHALIAPPRVQPRVIHSDAVLIGRVVGIESQDVAAPPTPAAKAPTPFRIAVVRVSEALRGVQGQEVVRVGFRPPPEQGGPRGPVAAVQLKPGQQGLFMLVKHHGGDFYTLAVPNSFVNSEHAALYEKEVGAVRLLLKFIDDAPKALKSPDAKDRFLAATVQIHRYRTPPRNAVGKVREEPIDAAESKLILEGLAGADWDEAMRNAHMPNPHTLFQDLRPTGFVRPRRGTQEDVSRAMQTWLRENAETFRIKRYVADER